MFLYAPCKVAFQHTALCERAALSHAMLRPAQGEAAANGGATTPAPQPAAAPAPAAQAAPAAGGPGGLPAGWAEAFDPTYGHPYWYNAGTSERSWTRPEAQVGVLLNISLYTSCALLHTCQTAAGRHISSFSQVPRKNSWEMSAGAW